MSNPTSTSRSCEYCGSLFSAGSRIDRRFCGDTCRNSFNRKIKLAERIIPHPNASEIIKIINKNYEILKKRFPGMIEDYDIVYYDTADFFKTGIDTRFYTSTYVEKGDIWYCVFERGYCILDDQVHIKDFPQQAEID